MSRLHRISVDGDGLKGQRLDETLSGCDLYTGPNGAGKSTRLLAVMAGLRGLAESPSDAVRPYIGPERPSAVVALGFDTGTLTRDLTAVRGDKVTRANVAAETLAGAHVAAFDLADFAGASETARESLIRRVAASSAADAQAVAGRVQRALPGGKSAPTMTRLLNARLAKGGAPGGAWLEGALEWARTAFTEANGAERRAKADAEAKAGRPTDAPPGTLAAARETLTRLEEERRAVGEQLATAAQAGSAARDHAAEGARLARTYGEVERRVGDLEQCPIAQPPDLAGLRIDVAAMEEEDRAAAEREREARAASDAAIAASAEAARRVAVARELSAQVGGVAASLRALATEADGACQHCGCADPLAIGPRVEAAEAACWAAAGSIATATEEHETLDVDRVVAGGLLRRTMAARLAAAERLRTARAALAVAERQAERIADETTRHAADLVRAREALALAEQQLAGWRERETPAGAPGDLDALTAQRDALDGELRAAKAAVELHVRAQERARAHQEAITTREAATAALAEVKALGDALKTVQGELAVETFGPIAGAANELLDAAGLGIRAVFHSIGDFGASIDGGYVQFWALSDSERAITGAAIASALIRLSGAPWKGLLLDGLERVDSARLPLLLRALAGMVTAGKLDNVLLAHRAVTPDEIPAVDGVTIHWLGGDSAAREAA